MVTNPTHQLPAGDYGATTLRNYRYQSIYGVVLLCGAATKQNDYRAIWCEQEDDLLAEISDTLFDSYQVKTKTPELGYWDINFKGFIAALKGFVRIETTYPGSIRYYNFICDAVLLTSDDKKKAHLCPAKLLEAAQKCEDVDSMGNGPKRAVTGLAKKCRCECGLLLAILKRLRIPPEPIRKEGAVDVLIATHLPPVPCCQNASVIKLRRAATNLIAQLDDASRLASTAPERHYACLDPNGRNNPQLRDKRVALHDFLLRCNEVIQPSFVYVAEIGQSHLAQTNRDLKRFYSKLNRGGLGDQADTMRQRAISAEAILLDLVTRPQGNQGVHHLKALVKGECDEARAVASVNPEPFGIHMFREVLKRIEEMCRTDPAKTLEQPKEVLLGIAGLLTEECLVWWSAPFIFDTVQ